MRIFDETKTRELKKSECDMNKGYFQDAKLVIGKRQSLNGTIQNPNIIVSPAEDNGLDITENIIIYKLYTAKDYYEREIVDLERWFETEYREQFEKCSRKIAIGATMRDGSDPKTKLSQLYAQAEINSNRINQLKQLINN